MLHSLIRHTTQAWNYDLVVLEEGLSPADKQQIASLAEGRDNISIRFFNVSACMQGHVFHVGGSLTLATWYRIFAPSIFRQYEKVLYLDADVIVLADIAELYNVDMGENWLAGCSDLGLFAEVKRKKAEDAYFRHTVGVQKLRHYVNAGVLLFNICQMNRHHVQQKCIEAALPCSFKHHDQDTLNHVCAGHVLLLDQAWNVFPDKGFADYLPAEELHLWHTARQAPRIVHYVGEKPWTNPLADQACLWWRYAAFTPYDAALLHTHLYALLDDVVHCSRNRWRYWYYKLLAYVAMGESRAAYADAKRQLRVRLHRARRWRAQLAQRRCKG